MALNKQNLIPASERDPEQVKELGRQGGVASGKARREKKIMAQTYAEFLNKKHKLKINGQVQEVDGWDLVHHAIKEGFKKNPTSMLKELREATDGINMNLNGDLNVGDDTALSKLDELLEYARTSGKKSDDKRPD